MYPRVTKIAATLGSVVAVAGGGVALAATTGHHKHKKPVSHKPVKFATGLNIPTSFAAGGGHVFEGDGGFSSSESSDAPPQGAGVYLLKGGKGKLLPSDTGLVFVSGLAWHKGALYVAGGSATSTGFVFSLQKWTGFTGSKFSDQKVIYTAPSNFGGFNGIAFGANGRLYVGADVGLLNGNDHGPSNISPYVYDVLSFSANGTGPKVVAQGIRQPWQLAFPKGSNVPFVSDLGQDTLADNKTTANPPDWVLKVKQGQNYGFPKCNGITKGACKGFAKPFKSFKPHTDIMGLAIIGKTLYMSSFASGKRGSGQVFSMPVKGGAVKKVASGFPSQTVGLGASGGKLYIGSVGTALGKGVVYTVKP
jgi:glucose/arabinose dehydrogenase